MCTEKIKACTLLFRKVVSDFKKEFDKDMEEGKSQVAKRFFGPIFNKVRNNKDNIKKKALSLRKKEKAIMIYQNCIIYEKPACRNLKAYYYALLKITFKRGAPSART